MTTPSRTMPDTDTQRLYDAERLRLVTQEREAARAIQRGTYPPTRPTCDCGNEGEWNGPKTGRRVFACAECYAKGDVK